MSNLYYLLTAQATSFLIHAPFPERSRLGHLRYPQKYTFSKLLYQRLHFKIDPYKNYVLKIAPSKNAFSKNTFLKLLPQKKYF